MSAQPRHCSFLLTLFDVASAGAERIRQDGPPRPSSSREHDVRPSKSLTRSGGPRLSFLWHLRRREKGMLQTGMMLFANYSNDELLAEVSARRPALRLYL